MDLDNKFNGLTKINYSSKNMLLNNIESEKQQYRYQIHAEKETQNYKMENITIKDPLDLLLQKMERVTLQYQNPSKISQNTVKNKLLYKQLYFQQKKQNKQQKIPYQHVHEYPETIKLQFNSNNQQLKTFTRPMSNKIHENYTKIRQDYFRSKKIKKQPNYQNKPKVDSIKHNVNSTDLSIPIVMNPQNLGRGLLLNYSIIVEEQMKLKIGNFQLGKVIGSGKFGDVFLCRHHLTGTLFALKKILKSTLKEYGMIKQFTQQLKIHYRLQHPNIIKLYAHFDDEYHIFLLMQYAEGGMLMQKLQLGEQYTAQIMAQMLNAVQYMHKLDIMHRDLKPENAVIFFGQTVKICDFGWAAKMVNNPMKTTFCGTMDYISPQMRDLGIYTYYVDMWSLGVLAFQMLTGFAPFKQSINSWKKKGVCLFTGWNWNIKYPKQVSIQAISFMQQLLKQNSTNRATIEECIKHQFITKHQKNKQNQILCDLYQLS